MNFNEINNNNRVYQALLHAEVNDAACLINKKTFAELYLIICFDLSHHENYIGLDNLRIEFNWELRNNTDEKYLFYFILKEKRKIILIKAERNY